MLTDSEWAGIRKRYVTGEHSVSELAEMFHVPARKIRERIETYNWEIVNIPSEHSIDIMSPPVDAEVVAEKRDDDLDVIAKRIVRDERAICDKLGQLFQSCVEAGDLKSLPLFKPAYEALKLRVLCERAIYGLKEQPATKNVISISWSKTETDA